MRTATPIRQLRSSSTSSDLQLSASDRVGGGVLLCSRASSTRDHDDEKTEFLKDSVMVYPPLLVWAQIV